MECGNPFRLLDVLSRHSVPYVIIGGHAVTYHGFVRATEDTDVVFRRTPEGERSLLNALSELHACWISDEIDSATGLEKTFPVSAGYIRNSRMMLLITDCGFLDIFDYIPGCPDEPVETLFVTAETHGAYRFVSLRWLRIMKAAANRPRDQIDLDNLPLDS